MFNLSVIYCCNIPPSGGESEFVYCYSHPFSLCFQDCYLAGTRVKTGTTHQGNSTTRPWWSGKREVREPTIGSGAEVRVPPHLSFTRLLLICHLSLSQKQNQIRVGAFPNQDDGIQAFSPASRGGPPEGSCNVFFFRGFCKKNWDCPYKLL